MENQVTADIRPASAPAQAADEHTSSAPIQDTVQTATQNPGSAQGPSAAQHHPRRSGASWFAAGLKNGIPICLGYFAVSFALGIAARNVGMNAAQSFFMSLTMVASAGQFAAIGLIGQGAGVLEMITTTLIVNLRYFLMSCSLTQKLDPEMKPWHRAALAYCITDEIFGLSVSVDGYLCPFYTYGITLISVSGWCAGTVLGVVVGNILPAALASALGVAMYGMFLAIIIPPAKKDRFIGILVTVSMLASWLFSVLPGLRSISSGFRVIILTILIAGTAAAVKPVADSSQDETPGSASGQPAGASAEPSVSLDNRTGTDVLPGGQNRELTKEPSGAQAGLKTEKEDAQ